MFDCQFLSVSSDMFELMIIPKHLPKPSVCSLNHMWTSSAEEDRVTQ